jgi:IS5 family transposase
VTARFDPELAKPDQLLYDDGILAAVRADLGRRHPRSLETGRPSTPIEAILRMLLVKHLYGWSYEETEQFVANRLALRQFCRLMPEYAWRPAGTSRIATRRDAGATGWWS